MSKPDSAIAIPVQLRFDSESDFYQNFVYELKTNKKLSSFCVDLLRCYYEDDEARSHITAFLQRNDPLADLQRQIEKAQLAHQQAVMSTEMLKHHVDNVVSPTVLGEPPVALPVADTGVEERLASVEVAIPSLAEKLDSILNLLAGGASLAPVAPVASVVAQVPVAVETPVQAAQAVSQTVSSETQTVPAAEEVSSVPATTPVAPPVAQSVPVAPAVVQTPVQSLTGGSNPVGDIGGVPEAPPKKKSPPASFKKASTSTKKPEDEA